MSRGTRRTRLAWLMFALVVMSGLSSAAPAGAQSTEDEPAVAKPPVHDHSSHAHGLDGGGLTPGAENRGRGMVYRDLFANTDRCPNPRLFEVGRSGLCTHGPDPAPEGVDISKDVPPVSTPGAGSTPAALCDGDGRTGFRTQVVYARSSDVPDRFGQYLSSFRTWANDASNIYNASAAKTGGSRHIRFVHDGSCTIDVANVVMPATADDTFSGTIAAVAAAGHNRNDRKYMLFVDANVYCGIGGILGDERPGQDNANNSGPSYGRNDAGCWEGWVAAHEHNHNLGGVQLGAPSTSGGWHCTDEYDVMCYSDEPNYPTMRYVCTAQVPNEQLFDCNNDDYFAATPASGSYLATHWNTANSRFLMPGTPLRTIRGTVADGAGNPVRAATVSTSVEQVVTDERGAFSVRTYEGRANVAATAFCKEPTSTVITVDGDENLNLTMNSKTSGFLGFGYRCSSTDVGWEPAANVTTLTGDDQSLQVALPFNFQLYGRDYTTAHIATNGFVSFGGSETELGNTPLPRTSAPNAAIYAYWDDLVVDGESSVRTARLGSGDSERFVIEWRNVTLFADRTRRFSFEVVLMEQCATCDRRDKDNGVRFAYAGIDPGTAEMGGSATVGLENFEGTEGFEASFNAGNLFDGLSQMIAPK